MELQISYSIFTKVQKEGLLLREEGGHRKDIKDVVRKGTGKDHISKAEVCPDHVHMLVEISPKLSVSSFMGYLKGKSSTMLYEQFGELRYKYRNREFWCRGYYVDTVGKNTKLIAEYIKNQLKEDMLGGTTNDT